MSTDPTALAREVLDAEAHATPEPWAHGDVDADETQTVAEWLAACALSPDAPAAGRVWSTWTRGDDGGVIVPAVTGDGPTSAGNAALIALLRTAGPALARAVIAVAELADRLEANASELEADGADDYAEAARTDARRIRRALNGGNA